MLLLLAASPAFAGSLDNLEVGGVWGTPGADNPTAIWWNPAGLALEDGFQFYVEGAPTFGSLHVDRANPDYGTIDPADALDIDDDGLLDTTYDYGGEESFDFAGVVPFAGLSYAKNGFGLGGSLSVPFARGGATDDPMGPNRYALRSGNILAIYGSLAAAADIADKVSIGASGSFVSSTWDADVDTETFSTYATAYRDQLGLDAIPSTYQDGYLEAPAYTTNLDLQSLKDTTFTFGVGVDVHPTDTVRIAASYQHGLDLTHEGPLTLGFSCPPIGDGPSTLAAAYTGTCVTDPDTFAREPAVLQGTAVVAYKLPSRLNLGVVLTPTDAWRVELMGGWVGWSVFESYDITTNVEAKDIPLYDPEDPKLAEETADLVSQHRIWLRNNRDSFWAGVDAKVDLSQRFTTGGRVLYDHGAVPDEAVSANNWDAPAVVTTLMGQYRPTDTIGIGLSYGHSFYARRTIEDSLFALQIAEDGPPEPGPTFWASGNGTYTGHVERIGVSVAGTFGADPASRPRKDKPDPGVR